MVDKALGPDDDPNLGKVALTDESFSLCERGATKEQMIQELGKRLAETPMSVFRKLVEQDPSVKKLDQFILDYCNNKAGAIMLSEEVCQWLKKTKPEPSSSKPAVCKGCSLLPIESKFVPSSAKPRPSAATAPPTTSTPSRSTQVKLETNVSRTYSWGAVDGKILNVLNLIYQQSSHQSNVNVLLENLAGILIKLLLKVDASSTKLDASSKKKEVLMYKGTFSSWVLTLRNYLEAILYTSLYDDGKLVRIQWYGQSSNLNCRVTSTTAGSGFELKQRNQKLQNLQVTCGGCSRTSSLCKLHHKPGSECKNGQDFRDGEQIVLLKENRKAGKYWYAYKEGALGTTTYLKFFPKGKAVIAFVLFCDKALRVYDAADLDTALSLTEGLLLLAQSLQCQKKIIRVQKQWWSETKPEPNATAHHLRVSGLNFNVSKAIQFQTIHTSQRTLDSCLKTLRNYKATGNDIQTVKLQLEYLEQAVIEAKEELGVLQHFQHGTSTVNKSSDHGDCFPGECRSYKLAFKHGSEFLTDSRALTVSSISVVLTQLEQTILLFTALNAGTPAPKKETIKQKSVNITWSNRFECVEDEGDLKTISSPVPRPSDYVDLKWLKRAEQTTQQNAEELKKQKMWLTLPTEEKNKEAWTKADELANNWNSEVKGLSGNDDWTTKEESHFLKVVVGDLKPFTTTDEKRQALYLEMLFLSDRLHVDHLFYGSKKRGFTLLRKYLQRVLDLGVILGCLTCSEQHSTSFLK